MSNKELNQTAHDLASVRAMIAEPEAEAETLTDKIKAAMIEQGKEELTGDGWKATWHNVTSSRLDTKALKAALPEIVQQFTKTSTAPRFCFTI